MIDIRSALWEIKYRIILITVCCTGLACFYAECKAPIYETNLLYTIVQGNPGEVVELVNYEGFGINCYESSHYQRLCVYKRWRGYGRC